MTKSLSGGIFPENSDLLINAFKNATQYFNRNDGDKVILQATAITVDTSDSYRVQKAGMRNLLRY